MMPIYSLNKLWFPRVFSQDSEWSVLNFQALRFQKKKKKKKMRHRFVCELGIKIWRSHRNGAYLNWSRWHFHCISHLFYKLLSSESLFIGREILFVRNKKPSGGWEDRKRTCNMNNYSCATKSYKRAHERKLDEKKEKKWWRKNSYKSYCSLHAY